MWSWPHWSGFTGTMICTHGVVWRWGPAAVHHKLYQPFQAFVSLCMLSTGHVGFLGSEATAPWHDQFHFICIGTLLMFAMLQCASAGGVAGEHPAHPRTSITEPVYRSAVRALMLVDALSDLALSPLTAVCPHWSAASPFKKHLGYSNPIPCSVQVVLLAACEDVTVLFRMRNAYCPCIRANALLSVNSDHAPVQKHDGCWWFGLRWRRQRGAPPPSLHRPPQACCTYLRRPAVHLCRLGPTLQQVPPAPH